MNYGKLDTDESIRDWNVGRLEVGLIHPASAGHGLNLQSGGSTLVWFGMIWRPGTVSADGSQTLEAGTGIWDRGGTAHPDSRYCR